MKVIKTNYNSARHFGIFITLDKLSDGRYVNWKNAKVIPYDIPVYKVEYMD